MIIDIFLQKLLVLIFLIFSLFESKIEVNIDKLKKVNLKFPTVPTVIFFISIFILTLWFIIKAPRHFVYIYLIFSFSVLIISHAIWLSFGDFKKYKIWFLSLAFVIILYRLLSPSTIIHNIFIVTAILWLASFFKSTKLLTRKRFVIFSLVWFFYDIIYVWFTPLSRNLASSTEAVKFPLALIVGRVSTGLADLVWANFLITLFNNFKYQVISILLLVSSNLILAFYIQLINKEMIFPLLFLWVPIGLIMLRVNKTTE